MTREKDFDETVSRIRSDSGKYGRIVQQEEGEGGYRWVPYGLTFEQVKAYYVENFPKEKIPYLNSDGDLNRLNLILNQMPKQDIDIDFCNYVKYDKAIKYNQFIQLRNSKYFDVGICRINDKNDFLLKCRGCRNPIEVNSFFIQSMVKFNNNFDKADETNTEKFENIKNYSWHPNCFKCVTCNEHLVDLAHCLRRNKLYCLRHYDELCRPRCFKCDEDNYVQLVTRITIAN